MKCGLYPNIHGYEKYPGGESLLDLVERSKKAITELVLPHMWKAAKEGSTGIHVAIVSHNGFLSDMIPELLKMRTNQAAEDDGFVLLDNAAWTRVVINIEVRLVEQMIIHKLTLTRSTGKPLNRRGSVPTYGHARDQCQPSFALVLGDRCV
jgi:broad specificity phosphatase PhoE